MSPTREGRVSRPDRGRMLRPTKQGVANSRRQDVARKRGRVSLHAFLRIIPPPPCLPYRCLVATRRLVIGLHRDGLYERAGDGTRTRDSLLGRQGVTGSPTAWYESAFEAERTTTSEFRAALRKDVARLRQKMSTSREGRMLQTQTAGEICLCS